MRSLSPAWSDDNEKEGGTKSAPIDLTASKDKITDRFQRAPTAAAKSDQLFSDTSDDEAQDPSPTVVDLTHSSDETRPYVNGSDSYSGTAVSDQEFLSIGYNSICAFAGKSLAFGEPRLPTDAEQRSFNHLYIEECIMKYERKNMISDQGRWEEVSMFDPLYRPKMTSLNPTYASRLQHALDTGLDDDAEGVFIYVSEIEDELEAEELEDDDHSKSDSENSSSRTSSGGAADSPETSLVLVVCTMAHLRSAFYWILDTGASTHSSPHKLSAIKNRKVVSKEVLANNGSAMKIHSRSDIRGTLYTKENVPVSKIVLVGVNHTPNSNFNLFSVAMCLKHGWTLNANFNTGCVLTKDSQEIRFDIRVKSGTGYLWVAKIVPDDVIEVSATNFESSKGDDDRQNRKELVSILKNDSSKDLTTSRRLMGASSVLTRKIPASTNQKRMCNGITREYAHVLMGHAHVTSAMV